MDFVDGRQDTSNPITTIVEVNLSAETLEGKIIIIIYPTFFVVGQVLLLALILIHMGAGWVIIDTCNVLLL